MTAMPDRQAFIPRWRSDSISLAGRRNPNEDALLELPDMGIWAVADGAGGHSMGDAASRVVIAALIAAAKAVSEPDRRLAVWRRVIRDALHRANAELRGLAQGMSPTATVAATVVVLAIEADRAFIAWVGNSRLYVLRDRALHQVTTDHAQWIVWADPAKPGVLPRQRRVLLRALGGADTLEPGSVNIRIQPGDKLLLCSDGLYMAFTEREIAEYLLLSPAGLVASVRRHVASRLVPDDLTVVAVECLAKANHE